MHIRDFAVVTDLDAAYRDAALAVSADVRNSGAAAAEGLSLRARLFDAQRKPVFEGPLVPVGAAVGAGETRSVRLTRAVANPLKWTAETPNLYGLTLELVDARGAVLEVVSTRVGFREVEVSRSTRAILVNGVAVKLNGVNSHMLHPRGGSRMDLETLRRDLDADEAVQRQHACAPRTIRRTSSTSTWPTSWACTSWTRSATSRTPPSSSPRTRAGAMPTCTAPASSCTATATTRASSSGAPATRAARGRTSRPSSPRASASIRAGPAWCYGGNTDLLPFEDIVGPRYPTIEDLAKVAAVPVSKDGRPSFMDEYLAATGNSLGELDEFWDLIWKSPRLTGGAVWDWMSPGMLARWRTTPDRSPNAVQTSLMAGATLVGGRFGNAVSLSGHDEWIEVHRHPATDLVTDQLTAAVWVYPRAWNGNGSFLTKGSRQFGLVQKDPRHARVLRPHRSARGRRGAGPAGLGRALAPPRRRLRRPADPPRRGRQGRRTRKPCRGALLRTAAPINIGRTADIHGQEHPGRISNAVFDRVQVSSPRARARRARESGFRARARSDAVARARRGRGRAPSTSRWASAPATTASSGPIGASQAELWQLKKSPQPVRVEAVDAGRGRVRITNRHGFTDLSELTTVWQLSEDDKVLGEGVLPLALAPGRSREVVVPIGAHTMPAPGSERRLLLSFRLSRDTAWAKKGHEVAWEQIDLPARPAVPAARPAEAPLTVRDDAGALVVEGKGFAYRFDRKQGSLVSMLVDGRELLAAGPQPSVWRAPVWNETEADWGPAPIVEQWRDAGLDRLRHTVSRFDSAREGDSVRVSVESRAQGEGAAAAFVSRVVYTVSPDGVVRVDHTLRPSGPMPAWLPRVGLQLKVARELRQLTWYGRGPFETYPDRKTGGKVGVHSGAVDEQYEPHLVPQDYGNKTDVRWAALTDGERGLVVAGQELLNVSAQVHDTDALARALYPPQLRVDDAVTLNLDHRVTGVGETPNKTHRKYRVLPGAFEYTRAPQAAAQGRVAERRRPRAAALKTAQRTLTWGARSASSCGARLSRSSSASAPNRPPVHNRDRPKIGVPEHLRQLSHLSSAARRRDCSRAAASELGPA